MDIFCSDLVTSWNLVIWSIEKVKILGSLMVFEKGSPKKKAKATYGKLASVFGLIA